jgi:hypothetical protein
MELVSTETLPIEEDVAFTPNAAARAVEVVRGLSSLGPSSRVVICTHGEVMGEVLGVIASEDGIRLSRRPPGLKGCAWILDFHKGKVATARYISPGR